MGRSPCCSEDNGVKKGPWSPEEDERLVDYVKQNGSGNWQTLPKKAGLNRCGKSCRLRWTNYLRPDIKRGPFSEKEETIIISLHQELGNKWSRIAAYLPGRTDNEIKNHWNTHMRKKLLKSGIDPNTHQQISDLSLLSQMLLSNYNFSNLNLIPLVNPALGFFHQRLQDVLLQAINSNSNSNSNPLSSYLLQAAISPITCHGANTQHFFHPQQNILAPPLLSDQQPLPSTSNTLLHCEGELSPQEILLPFNNNDNDNNKNTGFANIIDNSEYSLPSLVSAATPESSIVDTTKNSFIHRQALDETDIFDTWDKFLDDEACSSSFLKDIMG